MIEKLSHENRNAFRQIRVLKAKLNEQETNEKAKASEAVKNDY